ncbi:peptidoglycan D,D-transpeptidase FtsI family protein [Brevundimonas nasdae]|jgi:cell division protein FtsI (penicillin-binding protein 3)|uniref:peptidoglycan D,D-transpeptidase FtsI family protein n=1 Tax=Brevundimonas nasdae TaxID=172043 RepID=UPI0028A070BE|nr:penicillin-binding protein 2 [Brevundimonas nasdae]
MSVQDHRGYPPQRPAPSLDVQGRLAPFWRWVSELVWRLEHGFERARADARPEEDTRVRIFLIMIAFSVVFAGLAAGASYKALFADTGGRWSAGNPNALSRGDLTDRNGELLATNVIHYGLYINPNEIWDRDLAYRQIRRALPRIPSERLRRVLAGDRRLIVMNGLTPADKAAVHNLALGGVTFEAEDRRAYPLGTSAVHIVGDADTGGRGISGAELAFNDEIRAAGQRGESFPLSIDLRVQGVLENELAAAAIKAQAKGAVGIVTDVQTGEVLGMASWPNFSQANRNAAPDGATLNRAVSGHYEMGSVFKTFTVAAGLDLGLADMNTQFDASQALRIGNRSIKDFHAQNRVMSLEEVYLHSSNIGTSQLAVQMGANRMRDYFDRLGLLRASSVELRESAKPVVPRRWDDSTLASLSFGYGIMVTPAQVIQAMGALTNGGRMVPLSLRKGGAVGAQTPQIVTEETSRTILDLMRRNVVKGSGGFADAPGLRVGGKTGSANKLVNGRYEANHAVGSFAAVFPVDGPLNAKRYAILIVVDEPGSYPKTGAYVAAPAVRNTADRIAGFLGVERREDRWRTATGEKVPAYQDVAGDGL